jgi:hypothetical protein
MLPLYLILRKSYNERRQAQLLITLAPQIPPDLLVVALNTAQSITDDLDRTRTLTILAPFFPQNKRDTILAEALEVARNLNEELSCAGALTILSPYIPSHLCVQVIQTAQTISNDQYRAETLTSISSVISSEIAYDDLFPSNLRICAGRGRPSLLSDLTAVIPWIAAMAQRAHQPDVLSDLANAIIDTARCWP